MGVKVTTADGIGSLTLSRPPLNILTRELLREIREALARFSEDRTLRVLLLGAEGKHFSAGADVGEHLPPVLEQMIPEFMQTIAAVRGFPAPVVAAVRGRCLGGGFELVLGADLVVAAEGASFGQPEILLGVIPPAACPLLPTLAGPARAAEIVFTGDALSAADAERAGLVARRVPDERLDEEALALCRKIARHSAAALRVAKRALRAGEEPGRIAAFAAAERLYLQDLMATRDAREGLAAFLEKRSPTWTHQ
jgi:cyclohexa-1,5-dienecarbonyl-CoA hydratase